MLAPSIGLSKPTAGGKQKPDVVLGPRIGPHDGFPVPAAIGEYRMPSYTKLARQVLGVRDSASVVYFDVEIRIGAADEAFQAADFAPLTHPGFLRFAAGSEQVIDPVLKPMEAVNGGLRDAHTQPRWRTRG
jgi:hypothetical protein